MPGGKRRGEGPVGPGYVPGMTHPDERDTDKADPQTMPDRPGDDPREDVEDEPERRPRGNS